jgi:hypothetical protein
MNDWVGFVNQRDVKGLKCCVIAFRGKKSTNLASIPDTLPLTLPLSCSWAVIYLTRPMLNA